LFELPYTATEISFLILILTYVFRICRCADREAATWFDEETTLILAVYFVVRSVYLCCKLLTNCYLSKCYVLVNKQILTAQNTIPAIKLLSPSTPV